MACYLCVSRCQNRQICLFFCFVKQLQLFRCVQDYFRFFAFCPYIAFFTMPAIPSAAHSHLSGRIPGKSALRSSPWQGGISAPILPGSCSPVYEISTAPWCSSPKFWSFSFYQKHHTKSTVLFKLFPDFELRQPLFSGHDGFGLLNGQSFQQPTDFLPCQQLRFCFVPRPLKAAVVQPLVQQQEPVPFPQ